MADKLSLYNMALGHLGQKRVASLSEPIDVRRALDDFYDHAIRYAMEQGLWAFMVRTARQDASNDVTPAFGYLFAFPLPGDWVREVMVSTSETFQPPLTRYAREASYLFADFTPIFTSYVSNDPQYGFNLGAWPAVFTEFVAIALARMTCKRITGDTALLKGPDGLINLEKRARIDARSKDAMNLPPGFAPMSSWVRARRGYMTGNSGDSGPLPTGGF
jgi:hypothetical protein